MFTEAGGGSVRNVCNVEGGRSVCKFCEGRVSVVVVVAGNGKGG